VPPTTIKGSDPVEPLVPGALRARHPAAPGLPRGTSPEEVRERIGPPWQSVFEAPAQETPAAARIERARPTWYRFERE
jgi:hypothetical protein